VLRLRAPGRAGLLIDATLWLDSRRAAASDDLAETVDYGALAEAARGGGGGRAARPHRDAGRPAGRAGDAGPAGDARRGDVHKPQAPIEREFADVAVTGRRPVPEVTR
jgi:dihydroneopterin aldolase